jgi:hypothetical protein
LETLPAFLQTWLGWTDAYWYSALRIILIIGGLIAGVSLQYALVLKDLPFLIRQPLVGIALIIGPLGPLLLAQIHNLTGCQIGALMIGRQIYDQACDVTVMSEPLARTILESPTEEFMDNGLYQIVITVQSHWLYIALSWVVFLCIAGAMMVELYEWLAKKLNRSKTR